MGHQMPSLDAHHLTTWNVEQGKKGDILVAGGQGGDPQEAVMREDSEGEKEKGLVHGGEMKRWALGGAAGLRTQVGNRMRRTRRRRRRLQLHPV
jgi:hypothetical protein